ncbi:hypothetical protein GDO81_016422 [Engystomops pustulosus]|uniref:Uncharacterized protein n=1 Tax=Engystomops pustulosus TaxID=76066 RepID=A0AAV7ARZ6_ENGPU|nr:hypothetical protein GDO81_016422 [Engystomops pustulosus]
MKRMLLPLPLQSLVKPNPLHPPPSSSSIRVHPVYFCLCFLFFVFTHVLLIFCAIYYIYKWFLPNTAFLHAAVTCLFNFNFFFCFDIVYIIYKCTVLFSKALICVF